MVSGGRMLRRDMSLKNWDSQWVASVRETEIGSDMVLAS
jgi:hypothetical protein